MATANDITYVASGFYEDCVQLLENFKNTESIRFEAFCKVWKEMQFSLVFLCRKSFAELLEFCEETLNIAKQFITTPTELADQIGGLYLLYGLYYKIPVEDVKIRVTLQDWKIFVNLHDELREKKLHDASYIFVKLVTDEAYHHCLFKSEYGLEKNFKVRQDYALENPHSLLENIIDEVENGELAKVKKLSKVYDEQKLKLLSNVASKTKLQLFDKNFMDDVVTEIETLQEKRDTLSILRKKSKELMFQSKIDKSKYNYVDDRIRPKLGHGFDTDSSDDDNFEISDTFVKSDNLSLSKISKICDDDDDIIEENEMIDHSKIKTCVEESEDIEME